VFGAFRRQNDETSLGISSLFLRFRNAYGGLTLTGPARLAMARRLQADLLRPFVAPEACRGDPIQTRTGARAQEGGMK
jgi:hypothetical protein